MNLEISKYCSIQNHKVYVGDEIEFKESNELSFGEFSKKVYRHFEIKYPKFFKMDGLSKIAFLTSEILIQNTDIKDFDPDRIGVIIQNSHSTYDTDSKHVDTIIDKTNYFPSPSVFVYTLPNVMIGEICIRNKIQGETTCFIAQGFQSAFMTNYIKELFLANKIDICITGWVDYYKKDYTSTLFLIKKNKEIREDSISFIAQNVDGIIKPNV